MQTKKADVDKFSAAERVILDEIKPAMDKATLSLALSQEQAALIMSGVKILREAVSPGEWWDPIHMQDRVDRFVNAGSTGVWLRYFAVNYRAALLANRVNPDVDTAKFVINVTALTRDPSIARLSRREIDQSVIGVYGGRLMSSGVGTSDKVAASALRVIDAVYSLTKFFVRVVTVGKVNLPSSRLGAKADELVTPPVSALEFLSANPLHAYAYLIAYHTS